MRHAFHISLVSKGFLAEITLIMQRLKMTKFSIIRFCFRMRHAFYYYIRPWPRLTV